MGLLVLADALYARSHGGMVDGGPAGHFLKLPWWMVAPIALFILALCGLALWRHVTRRA